MKFSYRYTILLIISFLLFYSCKKEVKNKNDFITHIPILESWNNTQNKKAIIDFVSQVTNKNNAGFIPKKDRIAVFDNDGTLWSEQPVYFQFLYLIDRLHKMKKDNPQWKVTQPFKAALENDLVTLKKSGTKGLMTLVMATHAGITSEEFEQSVQKWLKTAKHPVLDKYFTELAYQPMIDLIKYLKENDFKVYIVSAGGQDFMRVWAPEVYGVPKEQIIGSSLKTQFSIDSTGNVTLKRMPLIQSINDREVKVENIHTFIGKKPVFAAGNSDGDLEMLQFTDSNTYPSFKLLVHHTDSIREFAYDRKTIAGKLGEALDEAIEKKWTIVDIEKDWKVVYKTK